jgi:hypothetical protein
LAIVTGEWNFFDPAMDTSLLKSLAGSRLGVGEPSFHSTLGENPSSAACLHQQEFDPVPANAVADRRHLLALLPKP